MTVPTSQIAARSAVTMLIDLDDFVDSCRRFGSDWGARRRVRMRRLITATAGASLSRELPPDEWIVRVEGVDPGDASARAKAMAQAIFTAANPDSVTIAIGSPRLSDDQPRHGESEVRFLARRKLVLGGHRLILPEGPPGAGPVADDPVEPVDAVIAAVRTSDVPDVAEVIVRAASTAAVERIPELTLGLILTAVDTSSGGLRPDGSTDWLRAARALSPAKTTELTSIHERSYLRLWVTDVLREAGVNGATSGCGPVERAEQFVRKNFADPGLRLSSVAKAVRVSPYYLSHLFRSERGTTFRQYVLAVRTRAAREMLACSTSTIESVAARTGFGTPKQLRNVFKREVGATPSQYRAQAAVSGSVAEPPAEPQGPAEGLAAITSP